LTRKNVNDVLGGGKGDKVGSSTKELRGGGSRNNAKIKRMLSGAAHGKVKNN